MEIKGIIAEDFLQYQKPCLVVLFPHCTFKCEKGCGMQVCQNSELALAPSINVSAESIVSQYTKNLITRAICFGGLEPFDSFDDMLELVASLRKETDDDIVIYTGYCKNEIIDKVEQLKEYPNIIIKFGRFVPIPDPSNDKGYVTESHRDPVLGINLSSANQYAVKIS